MILEKKNKFSTKEFIKKKIEIKNTTEKKITFELKQIVIAAFDNLSKNYKNVNQVNFFPIPDGDTGNNLLSTIKVGLNYLNNSYEKIVTSQQFWSVLSDGLLMGAVGNSGVIFSQIVQNFAFSLSSSKSKKPWRFIHAFKYTVKKIYKAIENPYEGTILTYVRFLYLRVKKQWREIKKLNINEIIILFYKQSSLILKILPKYINYPIPNDSFNNKKQIDAAALAMHYLLEGAYKYITKDDNYKDKIFELDKYTDVNKVDIVQKRIDFNKTILGYCAEFILQLNPHFQNKFKKKWLIRKLQILNVSSIIVVQMGNIVKLHCHTLKCFLPFYLCSKYGEFLKIKIDNMTLQNEHFQEIVNEKIVYKNELEILIVCSGDKWANYYEKFDISGILEYSKIDISTLDKKIKKQIQNIPAKKILILTNLKQESNVIDSFQVIENEINNLENQKCKFLHFNSNPEILLSCHKYLLFNSEKLNEFYLKLKKINKKFKYFVIQNKKINNNLNTDKFIENKNQSYILDFKNEPILCDLSSFDQIIKKLNSLIKNVSIIQIFIEELGNVDFAKKLKFHLLKVYKKNKIEIKLNYGLDNNKHYSFVCIE